MSCFFKLPDGICANTDCLFYNDHCYGYCPNFKTGESYLEDEKETKNVAIEGVGEDAEIVTNENGGKQSKSPIAMHLIDADFIRFFLDVSSENQPILCAIDNIAYFMKTGNKEGLIDAIHCIELNDIKALTRIAKVLQIGAERYEVNNWRLIPQESHINHALIHLAAAYLGDTQDDHIEHALCRIMMAYATDKTEGFDYNQYIKKEAA